MKDAIERLLEHVAWANELVLNALRATPDPEALRLYAHVLGAEHVWVSRIRGEPSRYAVWPTLGLDECERLAAENGRALSDVMAGLDDEGLRRVVSYRNSAGFEFTNTVGDMLLQATMHGHYHRGQIARQLRAVGTTPPATDFIQFARREQPGGTLDAGRVQGAAIR